jgi:hypothetical protein
VDKKGLRHLWFVVVSFGVISGSASAFLVISSGFKSQKRDFFGAKNVEKTWWIVQFLGIKVGV